IYSEQSYFDIIYNKTASLLEVSCEIGVLTCGDITKLEQMKEVGRNLGIAFQIKDDILDFCLDKTDDKPTGNDIREKKITLPMIYFLQNLNVNKRNEVLAFIAADDKTEQGIERLIKEVNHSDSIQKAQKDVEHYSHKAIELIENENENIYRTNLLLLVDFLIKRNK
ncbi:MAG: polyprenyl synthetase family protein, partial [Bacteroidales bacterium]|nr:polyprenyl synthetase family protein [Bacteroidales bacterium]